MWVGDWAVSNLTRVVTLDPLVLFERQKKNFVFFFNLFFLDILCSLWDLNSPPGIEPMPSAVKSTES